MTVRRLLKSCATPPASWPSASIFWAWRSDSLSAVDLEQLVVLRRERLCLLAEAGDHAQVLGQRERHPGEHRDDRRGREQRAPPWSSARSGPRSAGTATIAPNADGSRSAKRPRRRSPTRRSAAMPPPRGRCPRAASPRRGPFPRRRFRRPTSRERWPSLSANAPKPSARPVHMRLNRQCRTASAAPIDPSRIMSPTGYAMFVRNSAVAASARRREHRRQDDRGDRGGNCEADDAAVEPGARVVGGVAGAHEQQ